MTRGDPGAGSGQPLSRQFTDAPEAGRQRKRRCASPLHEDLWELVWRHYFIDSSPEFGEV